jgi:membrane-associated phospholipid phosphatase
LDYRLARALDSFSSRHDTFEELLHGYVSASEVLFAAAIVVLLLLPGPRRTLTRRAGVATAVALRLRLPGAVLLALSALLAVGRVSLGLHYPSDVLAGAALGAGVAGLLWLPPVRSRLHAVADAAGRRADSALRRQPSWLRGSADGG